MSPAVVTGARRRRRVGFEDGTFHQGQRLVADVPRKVLEFGPIFRVEGLEGRGDCDGDGRSELNDDHEAAGLHCFCGKAASGGV